MKKTISYILFLTLIVSTCLKPTDSLYADTVINNFSVKSNSGGNTAKDGEVIQGKTTSSVDITTRINGEIVEDIHEKSSSEYVQVEHSVIANGSSSDITTNVVTEEKQATHGGTVEPLVRQPVETVSKTETTASIINTNEKLDDALFAQNTEAVGHIHLLERIFFTFSKTFTYVLSNIFSY